MRFKLEKQIGHPFSGNFEQIGQEPRTEPGQKINTCFVIPIDGIDNLLEVNAMSSWSWGAIGRQLAKITVKEMRGYLRN